MTYLHVMNRGALAVKSPLDPVCVYPRDPRAKPPPSQLRSLAANS
jgi:hypothetical protein